MFYLLRGVPLPDIEVGQRVMVLADFSGVPAGTKGVISQNYRTGVMVVWALDGVSLDDVAAEVQSGQPLMAFQGWHMDGFDSDELEYLAFETSRHPWKGTAEAKAES